MRGIDLSVPRYQRRGALDVDLEVHGKQIRVIAAHLGLGLNERADPGAAPAAASSTAIEEHPMILLGDFNEWRPPSAPAAPAAPPLRPHARRALVPVPLPGVRPRSHLGAAAARPGGGGRAQHQPRSPGLGSPADPRRHRRLVGRQAGPRAALGLIASGFAPAGAAGYGGRGGTGG